MSSLSRSVVVDDTSVRYFANAGSQESIRWSDLRAVLIVTNDQGPFADDVHWVLIGSTSTSGCVIPQGVEGEQELIDRLLKLPGFDHQAMIDAMGSTAIQQFVCWTRQ